MASARALEAGLEAGRGEPRVHLRAREDRRRPAALGAVVVLLVVGVVRLVAPPAGAQGTRA